MTLEASLLLGAGAFCSLFGLIAFLTAGPAVTALPQPAVMPSASAGPSSTTTPPLSPAPVAVTPDAPLPPGPPVADDAAATQAARVPPPLPTQSPVVASLPPDPPPSAARDWDAPIARHSPERPQLKASAGATLRLGPQSSPEPSPAPSATPSPAQETTAPGAKAASKADAWRAFLDWQKKLGATRSAAMALKPEVGRLAHRHRDLPSPADFAARCFEAVELHAPDRFARADAREITQEFVSALLGPKAQVLWPKIGAVAKDASTAGAGRGLVEQILRPGFEFTDGDGVRRRLAPVVSRRD